MYSVVLLLNCVRSKSVNANIFRLSIMRKYFVTTPITSTQVCRTHFALLGALAQGVLESMHKEAIPHGVRLTKAQYSSPVNFSESSALDGALHPGNDACFMIVLFTCRRTISATHFALSTFSFLFFLPARRARRADFCVPCVACVPCDAPMEGLPTFAAATSCCLSEQSYLV